MWGSGSFSGTGVFIYNTYDATHAYGAITIAGSSNATLSAPLTGTYAGILMFQDRSAPTGYYNSINGNSNTTMDGAVYFKTQAVTIGGTSSGHYTDIVADSFSINGNTTFGVYDSASNTYKNDYSQLANGNPLHGGGYVFGQ